MKTITIIGVFDSENSTSIRISNSFKKLKEVKEKIDYYLENEDERLEIAKNGREFCLLNRTWDHTISDIINVIKKG